MANLLPLEIKKEFRKEYSRRVVVVVLVALMGVFVVAMISLFPTGIMLYTKLSTFDKVYPPLQETTENSDTLTLINETQKRLDVLRKDTFYKNISYGIFVDLFKIKTNAIEITRMSYTSSNNTLDISGKAKTRNDLKAFIDRIDTSDVFLPIENFPYADLSQKEDIDFRLTITLANDNAR
jgi:hypothetical protein